MPAEPELLREARAEELAERDSEGEGLLLPEELLLPELLPLQAPEAEELTLAEPGCPVLLAPELLLCSGEGD